MNQRRLTDFTAKAFQSVPERLYILGEDGKVAYAGGTGPRNFSPDELEGWLEKAGPDFPLKKTLNVVCPCTLFSNIP